MLFGKRLAVALPAGKAAKALARTINQVPAGVVDGFVLVDFANRFLTLARNLATGAKLSEYHPGFWAFSRHALQAIPWEQNFDAFIFDNQILNQARGAGLGVGEISCPARYFEGASLINFRRSVTYGIGGARAYRGKKKGPSARLLLSGAEASGSPSGPLLA